MAGDQLITQPTGKIKSWCWWLSVTTDWPPFIYSRLTTQLLDKLIPVKTLSRASRTGYKREYLHEWRTAFLQQQRLVISKTPDKCTEQIVGWRRKSAWQPYYAIKTPYCGFVARTGKLSDGWITSWPAPDWYYVHVSLRWTASRLDWEASHQQTRLNVKNITIWLNSTMWKPTRNMSCAAHF